MTTVETFHPFINFYIFIYLFISPYISWIISFFSNRFARFCRNPFFTSDFVMFTD